MSAEIMNFMSPFALNLSTKDCTLAYTSKGCTLIEVLPVPNAYTISQHFR